MALYEVLEDGTVRKIAGSAETLDKVLTFDDLYPVGSIYITTKTQATGVTSPAKMFGGTWERIKDCFLWASGDTTSITYIKDGTTTTEQLTVGSKGGEFNHKLVTSEMPSHNHCVRYGKNTTSGNPQGSFGAWSWYNNSFEQFSSAVTRLSINATQSSVGGNAVHNNMPPYMAVYVWERVE